MNNNKMKKRTLYWISKIIEDIILPLIVLVYIIFYWGSYFFKEEYIFLSKFFSVLVNDLGKHLMIEDNSIVTVATVFIGIYFSIYTMFTSIQTDSVMSNLGRKNFQKLLNILGIGFLSSFAYTLFSIFFVKAYGSKPEISVFIVQLLLIVFMVSAFQFGVIIYIILKKDISTTIEELDIRRKKELKQLEILEKLDSFLNKENERDSINRANEVSKIIEKKQERDS